MYYSIILGFILPVLVFSASILLFHVANRQITKRRLKLKDVK